MHIAVNGCLHGELDVVYETIARAEQEGGLKVDLLLCCGDFQAVRNAADLRGVSMPPKYYAMNTFWKYYSGEQKAPVLTILIGGNHEASSYLSELPYGGWVAPNIYYLGHCGCVRYKGVRIAGISGIYKGHDFLKGRYEFPPYSNQFPNASLKSVYHQRNFDVFRLKQLRNCGKIDIFMSHDWPRSVPKLDEEGDAKSATPPKKPAEDFVVHVDTNDFENVRKYKDHLYADMKTNTLGSPPLDDILTTLKPGHWFCGHLHCKLAALIEHRDGSVTKFLSLDKPLPRRSFLQIVEIPEPEHSDESDFSYDVDWLSVLSSTEDLLSFSNKPFYMPGPGSSERWDFTPSPEEKQAIKDNFESLDIFKNEFHRTAAIHREMDGIRTNKKPECWVNDQTRYLTQRLGLPDWFERVKDHCPSAVISGFEPESESPEATSTTALFDVFDSSEIALDENESDEESNPQDSTFFSPPPKSNESFASPFPSISTPPTEASSDSPTGTPNSAMARFKRRNLSQVADDDD